MGEKSKREVGGRVGRVEEDDERESEGVSDRGRLLKYAFIWHL